MRGKACQLCCRHVNTRITPAYAGKSYLFVPNRRQKQDHPRLCGEKDAVCIAFTVNEGSPPPMRGKGFG